MFKQSARSVIARLPARASAVPRVIGRRWNSSHASAPSNDMLWAAGSAVVFGSAGAYTLLGNSHHEAVAHGTTHMKELHAEEEEKKEDAEEEAPAPEEKSEEAPVEEDENAPSEAELKQSLNQAESVAVPRAAMDNDQSGPADSAPEAPKEESKSESSSESSGEAKEDGEPSEADIQASLHQAESAAVPRAAMTGEDHGEK